MARRTAVYTAIFGAYDDLPTVSHIDPTISYFLFADATVGSAPSPWELRRLPAIFADPQRDARRVKILPHLFLPDGYEFSVWLDANCQIKDLTGQVISELIGDAAMALPGHLERCCIFEEAQALISLGYFDSAARIARQISAYERAGLPRKAGLHHTNFLIRRHADPACMRFSNEWWEEICRYSKRDQLSFDFVLWKLRQTRVRTLSIPYADNPIFHSLGIHRSPHRITSEHLTASVRRNDLLPQFLATPYQPQFDAFPAEFLTHLRKLNEIVARSGEALEGNLCYFHHDPTFVHSPPDPRRGARRETFLRALAGHQNMLEIGFNAGHSALLALTHGDAKVTAIDIAEHAYTEAAARYLSEAFADRFQFFKLDSRSLPMLADELGLGAHDMIHIDGGHETEAFASDAACALAFCEPGTLLLIDDIHVPCIRRMTNRLVSDDLLAPYGDLETIESGAYVVLETTRRPGAIAHITIMNRLLEDVGAPPRESKELHSPFMAELISDLLLTPNRPNGDNASTVERDFGPSPILPLDGGIMDEIRRIGHQPFILVRLVDASASASARFVMCRTQNEAFEFSKMLAGKAALTGSRLLSGIDHALQGRIGDAAEQLFRWLNEANAAQAEKLYLGLRPGAKLPTYYNYPTFEIAVGDAVASDTNERLAQLIELMSAYERADGNDRSRFAIVEAFALAVARHLGIANQLEEAARIIARAFRVHPHSRHLRLVSNALDLRSRSKATARRS